jgi:hypothetical protein
MNMCFLRVVESTIGKEQSKSDNGDGVLYIHNLRRIEPNTED